MKPKQILATLCLLVLTLSLAFSASAGSPDNVSVGNLLAFGRYPQTADGKDETPIQWIVMERVNNHVLLLSRYVLDTALYTDERADVRWHSCTVRTWLNETFLHTAFNDAEIRAILPVPVNNAPDQCDPKYTTDGGEDTVDRVFFLSWAEANRYFHSDEERRCFGTPYAVEQRGLFVFNGTSSYFLRTPGSSGYFAGLVNMSGRCTGDDAHSRCGIRPALWVDLDEVTLDGEKT